MTALFSTSGLFKVFECFAVFTCVVLHRIGNRGSQVGLIFNTDSMMKSSYHSSGLVWDDRFRDGIQGDKKRG